MQLLIVAHNSEPVLRLNGVRYAESEMRQRKCPNCDGKGVVGADFPPSTLHTAQQLATLTPRELEVLERLLAGDSIGQAALKLGRRYSTVRNQRRSILNKLEIDCEIELLCIFVSGWLGRDLPAPRQLWQRFESWPNGA